MRAEPKSDVLKKLLEEKEEEKRRKYMEEERERRKRGEKCNDKKIFATFNIKTT